MLEFAQPVDDAHGLISNWDAPASPARCSFPARTEVASSNPTNNIAKDFILLIWVKFSDFRS